MASSSELTPPKEPFSAFSLIPQPPKLTGKTSDAAAAGTAQPETPSSAAVTSGVLSPSPEESAFFKSSHLTRQELLRRRLHQVKQLSRVYGDYFWVLMGELRVQFREYYWKYGVSLYKEEEEREVGGGRTMVGSLNVEGSGETNTNNNCSFWESNDNGVGVGGGKLALGLVMVVVEGLNRSLGATIIVLLWVVS